MNVQAQLSGLRFDKTLINININLYEQQSYKILVTYINNQDIK